MRNSWDWKTRIAVIVEMQKGEFLYLPLIVLEISIVNFHGFIRTLNVLVQRELNIMFHYGSKRLLKETECLHQMQYQRCECMHEAWSMSNLSILAHVTVEHGETKKIPRNKRSTFSWLMSCWIRIWKLFFFYNVQIFRSFITNV